jgi:hypothetical protein
VTGQLRTLVPPAFLSDLKQLDRVRSPLPAPSRSRSRYWPTWSTCGCPKDWGAYGGSGEQGWWIALELDDGLGSIRGEALCLDDAERDAERRALAHLRRQDPMPLSLTQRATRAIALAQLVTRVEGTCADA